MTLRRNEGEYKVGIVFPRPFAKRADELMPRPGPFIYYDCVKRTFPLRAPSCMLDIGIDVCSRPESVSTTATLVGNAGERFTDPGRRRPHIPAPKPPPPPLWLINILKVLLRPPAGYTVKPRPHLDPASDGHTTAIDNSARYADAMTKVIDDAEANGDVGQLDGVSAMRDVLDQQRRADESCLSDPTPREANSVELGPMVPGKHSNGIDDGERASFANICASKQWPGLNRKRTYKASAEVDGMQADDHKGHLCAAQFACPGNARANLTPLTPDANIKGMYHDFERCVANRLKTGSGEKVFMVIVPVHTTDELRPVGMALIAVGNQGYQRSLYVQNQAVYNPGAGGYCN